MDTGTVHELTNLLGEGETRTFARSVSPTGREPPFYRIAKRGEFAIPQWLNRPSIEERPRPAILTWSHCPLPTDIKYRFCTDAKAESIADLNQVTTGLYLVSEQVVDMLDRYDPYPRGLADAELTTSDGVITSFKVLMPGCVLDAVDVTKTDILIENDTWVTRVKFPNGYVLRPDLPKDVTCFLERWSCHWLWREDLVQRAFDIGLRSLRAEPTYIFPNPYLPWRN